MPQIGYIRGTDVGSREWEREGYRDTIFSEVASAMKPESNEWKTPKARDVKSCAGVETANRITLLFITLHRKSNIY